MFMGEGESQHGRNGVGQGEGTRAERSTHRSGGEVRQRKGLDGVAAGYCRSLCSVGIHRENSRILSPAALP